MLVLRGHVRTFCVYQGKYTQNQHLTWFQCLEILYNKDEVIMKIYIIRISDIGVGFRSPTNETSSPHNVFAYNVQMMQNLMP